MIIFLYGPDDYRREGKKRELIAGFEQKHSRIGIGHFDFRDEGAADRFEVFVKSQSMFSAMRLAVATQVLGNTADAFAHELKSLLKSKDLVVVLSERDEPRKIFSFLLRKPVVVQKFGLLRGAEWESFVRREAERRNLDLEGSACALLSDAYKGDSWRVATELEKARFLGKPHLDSGDLRRLDVELAPDFWPLLEGLKSQSRAVRLSSLERFFSIGEPAGKVFYILASQWLERAQAFASYDALIKSGRLDYEEALVDLAMS